jgi:aldose 1-epimerase
VGEAASGRQVEIVHGRQRATVAEVGGGLRTYTVGDVDVVDGYAVDEMCPSGRGQLLMPWPNRIADGAYEFGDVRYELALSEPSRHNAIHGLVRFANWSVESVGAGSVVMAHRLHPQPGYPFLIDLTAEYRLDDSGLRVAITATNRGDAPAPFGAGAHPYVRLGHGPIDGLTLRCPATTHYESDERGIPMARVPVEGSAFDFRRSRPIGDAVLDTAFADLVRDRDGRVTVDLTGPAGAVSVWMGPAFTDLMLYSGDTLGDVGRRRRALAIEPMTCPPNAFRTGERLVTLAAGETFTGEWGINTEGIP